MANNRIKTLLEFANLQMASEAFLVRHEDGGTIPTGPLVADRLIEGNTHASRFTETSSRTRCHRG